MMITANPIDEYARKVFGIQRTLKAELAFLNPRPAALVLRTTYPLKHPLPWGGISDQDWLEEVCHNSGSLICVLLRHPELKNNRSFLSLFDDCEKEFMAAKRRAKWYLLSFKGRSLKHEKHMEVLRSSLESLEPKFKKWAINNRNVIDGALLDIVNNEDYYNGNAMTDLERVSPDWY